MPAVRVAFKSTDRKLGGAGRLAMDAIVGLGTVDGWTGAFVTIEPAGRWFTLADVRLSFACARIKATSGDTLPKANDERLGAAGGAVVGTAGREAMGVKGTLAVGATLLVTVGTLLGAPDELF